MILPPGHYVENGREYVLDECPACGRANSFYWNPRKQKGQCWSQKHCGIKVGSLEYFIRLLAGMGMGNLPDLEDDDYERPLRTLPPVPGFGEMIRAEDSPHCMMFLSLREVPTDHVLHSGLLCPITQPLIVAPLFTPDPSLPDAYMERKPYQSAKGWMFRHTGDPTALGHKGMYVYAPPAVVRNPVRRKWGLIVEGVGDILKHPLAMTHGVAVCGVKINPVIGEWLSRKFHNLVVWGDNDAAGASLFKAVRSTMRGFGVGVRKYVDTTCKDPGEALPISSFESLDIPFDKL